MARVRAKIANHGSARRIANSSYMQFLEGRGRFSHHEDKSTEDRRVPVVPSGTGGVANGGGRRDDIRGKRRKVRCFAQHCNHHGTGSGNERG
jgi:hypothetical protein